MIKGQIYFAAGFGPAEIEQVRERFSRLFGEPVELEARKDESLIGGFRAAVGGRIYDASVLSKLREVRDYLSDKEQA